MHSSGMRTVRSSSRLSRGVCLSACWDTPPRADPPGPGTPRCKACWDTTCNACWDSTHPQDLLQGMLGYHLQGMLEYHPPGGQTHTCKNITFATSLRTVKMHLSVRKNCLRKCILTYFFSCRYGC